MKKLLLAASLLLALISPAHAQSTKAALITEVGTNYPDNTTGLITPALLRSTTIDILNSIMPTAPVVSGNFACFNGTTGLLQDCGTGSGQLIITSSSAQALVVGRLGATNPAFNVDSSTGSQASGLNVKGDVTGGTVAISAIDSGANTNLTINAKGTGTIGIGNVSTGVVTITPALTEANINAGSAAGATLTLKSTTNGTPSGDIANLFASTVTLGAGPSGGGIPSVVNIGNTNSSSGGITVNVASSGSGLAALNLFNGSGGKQVWVPGPGAGTTPGTISFPAATDQLVARATTDTLSNKSISVANGNTFTLRQATVQKFTTGSGATYTTPATSSFAIVKFCGAGGGGSGSGTTTTGGTGGNGTTTTFNSIACTGGSGATASVPGAGGTCSGGSPNETWAGAVGGTVQTGVAGTFLGGGQGAATVLFGGTNGVNGALAATGAGGAGGAFNGAGNTGGGGGSGACAVQVVAGVGATYTYTIGTAGGAGTAGTSGNVGFAGSTGYMEAIEY